MGTRVVLGGKRTRHGPSVAQIRRSRPATCNNVPVPTQYSGAELGPVMMPLAVAMLAVPLALDVGVTPARKARASSEVMAIEACAGREPGPGGSKGCFAC